MGERREREERVGETGEEKRGREGWEKGGDEM